LDLLTTYTAHSELQIITALSLMYTIYRSLEYAKSSQSSLAVSWQRIYNSLTVAAAHINSSLHSLTLLFTTELPALNLLSRFLNHLPTANSGTLNPSLCCNCQLSRCHLFSINLHCRFSAKLSLGLGSSLCSLGANPTGNIVS
jgi:hypothetical protein